MIGKGGGKPKAKVASMGRQRGSGAGSKALPPSMKARPQQSGNFSRKNNNGNPADREKPNRRQRRTSLCYITQACTMAYGKPDDCYELSLLRMYREEYVKQLPDGEEVLAEYYHKAPLIVAAIDALGPQSRDVWQEIYHRAIQPAVCLITNGRWDEAYQIYHTMCHELEQRFLPSVDGTAITPDTPASSNQYRRWTLTGGEQQ